MTSAKTQKPGTRPPTAAVQVAKTAKVKVEAKATSKLPANEAICAVTTPLRWQILKFLQEPMTPQQLAEKLDVKPAVVLYHLKILEEAGAVRSQPFGDYKKRFQFVRVAFAATVMVDGKNVQADFDLNG